MQLRASPLYRARRCFAAAGALFCGLSVALGAYSAHALEPAARDRIDTALMYLFLHGLALALFAPRQRSWLEFAALAGWGAGTLLFCGSLILSVLASTSTALAPLGGMLLIAAWLMQAAVASRR